MHNPRCTPLTRTPPPHPRARAQLVLDGFTIPARVRLRHIPGARPAWLLGHLLTAKTKHNLFLFDMWEDMGARYGKVRGAGWLPSSTWVRQRRRRRPRRRRPRPARRRSGAVACVQCSRALRAAAIVAGCAAAASCAHRRMHSNAPPSPACRPRQVFKWFWGTLPIITIRGARARGRRGSRRRTGDLGGGSWARAAACAQRSACTALRPAPLFKAAWPNKHAAARARAPQTPSSRGSSA